LTQLSQRWVRRPVKKKKVEVLHATPRFRRGRTKTAVPNPPPCMYTPFSSRSKPLLRPADKRLFLWGKPGSRHNQSLHHKK
jgi:hypothetical protein